MTKAKKVATSLIVVGVLFIVIFVSLMVYYFGASFPGFYNAAREEFSIPGLSTSFTPQGLAYDSSSKKFLVSGYVKGKASHIYVVNKSNGQTERDVTILHEGKVFDGHAGGIAVYNDLVFITGTGEVFCLSLSEVLNNETNVVETKGSFKVSNNSDFLALYNDQLIVGEFYQSKKYKTSPSHHLEVGENEVNHAMAFAYRIDSEHENGIASTTPRYAISLPDKVQGMCLTDAGEWVLSCSYSLSPSTLMVMSNPLSKDAETREIDGHETDLYVFSSATLRYSITAPSMSEGVVSVSGRVYVLFENNAKQYRAFTRTRLSHAYSLDI